MLDKLHGYLFNKRCDTGYQGNGPDVYLGLGYVLWVIIKRWIKAHIYYQSRNIGEKSEHLLGKGEGWRNYTKFLSISQMLLMTGKDKMWVRSPGNRAKIPERGS